MCVMRHVFYTQWDKLTILCSKKSSRFRRENEQLVCLQSNIYTQFGPILAM